MICFNALFSHLKDEGFLYCKSLNRYVSDLSFCDDGVHIEFHKKITNAIRMPKTIALAVIELLLHACDERLVFTYDEYH